MTGGEGRMARVRRGAALLLLIAGAGGCSGEPDRPPIRPACSADDCLPAPGSGVPGAGGAPGGGGGSGGGVEGEEVTVTGAILQYTEDQFLQPTTFTGPGELEAFETSGARFAGTFADGTFTLPEVPAGASLWLLARPSSAALHFPTWTFIEARDDIQVTAPLLQRAVVEEIMSTLTVPGVPLQGTAQVVLRVLNANQTPVEGVTVAAPAAQLIIYGAQGTWSETEVSTDTTGLVVLGNVAASPVPGNELDVILSGAGSGSFALRVANDTATFVHIIVR